MALPAKRLYRSAAVPVLLLGMAMPVLSQKAPSGPERPWNDPQSTVSREILRGVPDTKVHVDPAHTYTLAELIDLAESHNPDTRIAWENAKVQAAELGIARSLLYPTLAAAALAQTTRQGVLFGTTFVRQTLGLFQAQLEVNYLIFDFGERQSRIQLSRSNLLGADYAFNSTHLRIIYETTAAFYRLSNAEAQVTAVRATLANAQTVQEAVEQRLANGLSTRPDALEARSSTAQSEYDLQAAIGAEDIARGELLTLISADPSSALRVQPIEQLSVPDSMSEPLESLLNRALQQRPDLLQRVESLRGSETEIRSARSAFLPSLGFQGQAGELRAHGQQDQLPGLYAGPTTTWNAQVRLSWTLFDGGERRNALQRAHSDRRRAESDINALRDQISEQVWESYADSRTALRRRQAAAAFLAASTESYSASLEAYRYGVRSLLDVVSAQRTLAQARATDISARAQVLSEFTNLAFQTGDLLHLPPATNPPAPNRVP